MTSDTLALHATLDAAGRIGQDVHCIHCGYNLRSLLPGQACPECNRPVGESLRGDLLQFSDPAWLARLVSGMGWILVSSILLSALGLCRGTFWQWVGTAWPLTRAVMPSAGFFASGLMSLIGVWKVTSPEPRLLDAQPGINVSMVARSLVTSAFALIWTATLLQAIGVPQARMLVVLDGANAMHAVGWIFLCIHLARLGHRLPAPGLARLTWVVCATATVVASLLLLLGVINARRVWITGGIPRTGTGMLLRWPWAIMIWRLLSRTLAVLTWIWAATYRQRFRKMLRQSQETMA